MSVSESTDTAPPRPKEASQERRRPIEVHSRDDESPDSDRPAKKKKVLAKSNTGTVLAIGGIAVVLLLCLVGTGATGLFFVLREKPDKPGPQANLDAKNVDKTKVENPRDSKDAGADPNQDPGQKKDPLKGKTIAQIAPKKDSPPPAKSSLDLKALGTCAIVDLSRTATGALFEAKVLGTRQMIWVERAQVDKVVRELELQALFSPQGGSRRGASENFCAPMC